MRLKGLALIAIVPMLVGAAMPVFAQTLADVAKKEEERRKKISEPAKVYTNKDLASVPASSTPPPATSSTSSAPATGTPPKEDEKEKDKEKDQPKEPVKDQKYWASRLKALQETLTRDEGYAEAMQTRLNSLQTDFVNRDDPAQRAVIERDRNKVQAELERLKKAVVDEKKAIDDFLEEARRAGVPPGWLR